MTLPSELLPAAQHYALLAVAVTLLSLSVTHFKWQLSVWWWLVMMVLPVVQMVWSLGETVWATVAGEETFGEPLRGPESHLVWATVIRACAHGVAIALVLVVVLLAVRRHTGGIPRRVRLEPTVGFPFVGGC